MKRDYELIRLILRDVQDAPGLSSLIGFTYDAYDQDTIAEHVELLTEAGLLQGHVTRGLGGGAAISVERLTWRGHDFLEAMRDDGIWARAKETVLKPLGGVAFDVLLDWLKWKVREKLGFPDG